MHSSTSSTCPIASTRKLTVSSSLLTTTFISGPLLFSSPSPSPFRKSIAVTIFPRRLINPRTALPASGTCVIACSRITSCTSSTGIPYNRCPIQNVQNCRRSLTLSPFLYRCFFAHPHPNQLLHVQQIRHLFLDHHRSPHPRPLRWLLQHHVFFHDVQNLFHYQPHRPLAVRVHNHLHRLFARSAFRCAILRFQHLFHSNQRHNLAAVLHHFPLPGLLHALSRELFQTRDHGKLYRHPAPCSALENQQGLLPCALRFRSLLFQLLLRIAFLPRVHQSRGLGQPPHVQNQRHSPIAQNRRSHKRANALQLLVQRLHHDLFRVRHPVHHQSEMPCVRLHHHDVDSLILVRFVLLQPQLLAQIHQRQQLPPQPVHRRPLHSLQTLRHVLLFNSHQLQQVHLRNREPLPAARHQQCRNNRQRQRNLHLYRRSRPRPRLHFHCSADFLNIRFHHFHPPAAPGNVCHRLPPRKSRHTHQVP